MSSSSFISNKIIMRRLLHTVKKIWYLPSEYTKLTYIQSSWTQRINTLIKLCSDDVVETEFANVSASWYWAVYWVYQTWQSSAFYANWTYYWYDAVNTKVNTGVSVDTNRHVVEHSFPWWTITLDGNATNFTPFVFSNTVNNYIFSRYYNGSYWYNLSGKIKWFKVTRNWQIILDMIPVKRNSDDVIWMFDKVSWTFFENIGTWDFTWE